MQERRYDGTLGEARQMSSEELVKAIKDPNVAQVDVFEGTPEQIKQRQEDKEAADTDTSVREANRRYMSRFK